MQNIRPFKIAYTVNLYLKKMPVINIACIDRVSETETTSFHLLYAKQQSTLFFFNFYTISVNVIVSAFI